MKQSEFKIKTTTDQIVEYVMNAVFAGELTPGCKLREIDITNWLGVSRTPVREALRVLESKGIVEINTNKGSRVKKIFKEDLFDIYEARILIEMNNIPRFIKQLKTEEIEDLTNILESSSEALREKKFLQYFEYCLDFHQYLIEKGGNKWLIQLFYTVRTSLTCAQLHFLNNPEGLHDSLKEHKALLTALKDKDESRSKKLLHDLLHHSYQRMMNLPYSEDTPEFDFK